MTVVAQILDRMSGVAKPQRKFLLTLFATMLVTRTRLNFLNLSRHSSLSEKTFRRHFRKPFAFASFNQLAIASAMPKASTKLFAQDATFSKKCGKHTYGLDKFWNGCAARAEKGLEVSLISIVDVERNQSFALSAEQTPPQPAIKKPEQTNTRIDFYLEHLQRTVAYLPESVKYGVFDGARRQTQVRFGRLRCGLSSGEQTAREPPTFFISTTACNESADAAASSTAKFPSLT